MTQLPPLNTNPTVSVLIAVYNAEKYLEISLDSIVSQTYSNIEILICNDASTDNSSKIIDKYKPDNRISVFHNENNLGYLKTMNKLFELATGELITTQDADDISSPNRIEKQISAFINDTELGLCGTDYEVIDKNGNKLKSFIKNKLITDDQELKKEMEKKFPFSKGRVMFRKEVQQKIGLYRLYFDRIGWEDYDWTSMVVEQFKATNLKEKLYYYRVHFSAVLTGNIDIKKYYADKIIKFFIQQRKKTGSDSLSNQDLADDLIKMEETLEMPYKKDPSLIDRINSHSLINMELYGKSLVKALNAVKGNRFIFKNYSNVIYCLYIISRRILKI